MKKVAVFLKLGVVLLVIGSICAKFAKAGLYDKSSKLSIFSSSTDNNHNDLSSAG